MGEIKLKDAVRNVIIGIESIPTVPGVTYHKCDSHSFHFGFVNEVKM